MAAAAASSCVKLCGFSGCEGDGRFSGLAHVLVAGAPNPKQIRNRRGAFHARHFTVNTLYKSRAVRIPGFRFKSPFQSLKYSSTLCSRRHFYDGLDNKAGRSFLIPLAAVATGNEDWKARWEDSQESQVDFSRILNLNLKTSGDRLLLLGILALTGLGVTRLLRGSSLLSLSAVLFFLCLCLVGFHHRIKPKLLLLGEKLKHLIRNVSFMPISSKQQLTSVDSPFVTMIGLPKIVDHFTGIIREIRSKKALSVNDLMTLRLGITNTGEDLYRAASALQAEESLLQLKLQNSEEELGAQGDRKINVTAANSAAGALEPASGFSGLGVAMKWKEEDGNSSSSSNSQEKPFSTSNHNLAVEKISGTSVNYKVITAGLELQPVSSFSPVVLSTQAAVDSGVKVNRKEITGQLSSEITVPETNGKQDREGVLVEDFKRSSEDSQYIISKPDMSTSWDINEGKTDLKQHRRETLLDKSSDGHMLRHREEPRSENVIASAKSLADPWHDGESRLSEVSSSVMQDVVIRYDSVRWGNADNDNPPSVSSVGVAYRDGGRVRGNSKPSVDLWGSKAPSTAGRAERGTLMRMKATPKGSVDNVNNDSPENPLEDWNEEQMSQGQMRRRDSTSDRRTSGQQYVPDGPESWNNGGRRKSAGNSQKYRESERDSDAGKVSGRDRERSYGGSSSQIRKMREEEDYGRDRKPANGYNNFEERTRSYRIEEDAQMLNEEEEGEEEEEFLRTRDSRDMREDYFDDESNSWEANDVGTSGSGMDRRRSQVRRDSNPRAPPYSRSPTQRVDGNESDEAYDEEDDQYITGTRNLEAEEQASGGTRSRSLGETQYSGGEEQRKQDYAQTSERRNTDQTPYLQKEVEVGERNLPVRQPSRMQMEKFERLLDEGDALLEEGMKGLEGRIEVGVAERLLYEAASLFEGALEIDPSSVMAVGLWGNTLLVHGELKLRLSQQLRSMLPSPSSYSLIRSKGGLEGDDQREALEMTLQGVCEECEELLVDAGRKYRKALSLDRTDMRALYNWGLALCYRGQLIADEGGERAIEDADKVYMAAIDKFEAMLGISQEYAAGALYNWGLAMRDRARLRPMGDRDRVKLLLQAKELFQDSVRLDPNNGQARAAVTAAVAELQELKRFEEMQNEQESRGRSPKGWWQ
ncbi:hypothetical protein R1sor_011002 [Riccia sorocarpa]|uniref:Uncharacterized protein n=1 Tax=Riccia sorocarpa TaxID=122646 RepID=A0ABD3I3R2_9MARC